MNFWYRLAGALVLAFAGPMQGCVLAPAVAPLNSPEPIVNVAGAPLVEQTPEPQQQEEQKREPIGVITLQEALGAVLSGNPELAAYSWEVRASDGEVLQAGLRPNPELSVNPENFVGSGVFGSQVQFQNTLQLSQLVELGGKREQRTEAAGKVRDRVALEYEAKRVEVFAGATLDFIAVASAEERVKLSRLATAQAEALLGAARKRAGAGAGSLLEEKRAQILIARARISERHAAHQFLTAKQKLAARWGSKTPLFNDVRGELFSTHAIPTLESLLGRIESSPERRVAVAEINVREAEAALARTKRTPDITLAVAWRHGKTWDDQTAVAGFSVPLQVFNRAEGEIAAAEARTARAVADTRVADIRLRSVLFGLYQEILHAQGQTEAMRSEIVPRAEESLALARNGFIQGLYTQFDMLDAQRTMLEVREEYIQAASTYHELVAEVEKLLGEAL